ncbi:alpha-N-acetylglucosaminidase [Arenibacter algicola]|uniref:alpha-N-acetylglucosaminidase n=1 Tax=Arenibacter algicola TaxID=616991 RepID=UPI001C0691D3|nr:alpha-N-acetylglucosaminidase [Arenibacter algicola]MBU2903604.1 alpha-N-acetylglucosaminidase [Arenibacter algicola]
MITYKNLRLIALASILITAATSISCNEHIAKIPETIVSPAVKSARDLAGRIVPDQADNFIFEEIAKKDGEDVFELETSGDKIVVRGNNGVSMAMGLNWYLKEFCNVNVSLRGNNLNLPEKLPIVEGVLRKTSWAEHRYFLNYCAFGYSMPWWDWSQWERLIDFMALNGVNAPLAITGQEATWQAVCKRLGMDDDQISDFLAGPPYLPFGWMGCLDGWGGPLPQSWISSHEVLGKKILERERSLGMVPIQQGFTGHVPPTLSKEYPDAKINTIKWTEFTSDVLDPLDPLFQQISDIFIEEQTHIFGTDHMYAADPFIEMQPPSGDLDYLGNLSKAIYKGMSKSDPEAVWVFQTWCFSHRRDFWTQPRIKAFLDGAPNDKMICLDLYTENKPMWNRTESFYGKPWLWCNIQNFGDKVFLGGGLNKISDGIVEVRQNPANVNLKGLGFVNEGLGYNPIVQDLMFEMAWSEEGIDLKDWVGRYAEYRYGGPNLDIARAWNTLKETVYSAPMDGYASLSMITNMPTLKKAQNVMPYSNKRLASAWEDLLKASDEFGDVDTYKYDVVNIARQVLSNHAAVLHGEMASAYDEGNLKDFEATSQDFIQLALDLDELLGTREEFLLGKNLEDAKRWGVTPEEKSTLEWNARRMITLWGPTTRLNDYALKEWSGLISSYYKVRWKKFIDEIQKELQNGKSYNESEFKNNLIEWMDDWSDAKDIYPHEPKGESVAIAKKLWAKYGQIILTTN